MRRLLFAGVALVILVADQLTKAWVTRSYPMGAQIPVWPPVLYLLHTTNDGVAWSLFRGHTAFFSLVAVVFSIGILLLGRAAMQRSTLLAGAMGLLLGGSVGNLVDRIRLHEVVDFIDVHLGHWYEWPTFNVADSAITTGMVLLAAYFWFAENKETLTAEASRDGREAVGERGTAGRVRSERVEIEGGPTDE